MKWEDLVVDIVAGINKVIEMEKLNCDRAGCKC